MSIKIHFNNFDLRAVDKSILPHIVYNLNNNEYYVKTKKAEASDKINGTGCLKFNNYEWLIKNHWFIILPSDCSLYMKNNYTNTYQTITILSDEFDSSNVINMKQMFYNCTALTIIPELNTSKVTNMFSMFALCKSLTSIPQLDTSKVTNINYMFYSCTSLPEVFPWVIDCSSIYQMPSVNGTTSFGTFESSSVKTVHFKNVKSSLVNVFTAVKLGSQLTNIIVDNTID